MKPEALLVNLDLGWKNTYKEEGITNQNWTHNQRRKRENGLEMINIYTYISLTDMLDKLKDYKANIKLKPIG